LLAPREDPDEGESFPRMRTVRMVGHPVDADALELHPSPDLHRLPHSHILVEDYPFERKQKLGEHIDRWHFPSKEAA
jgi:hypothetical protein